MLAIKLKDAMEAYRRRTGKRLTYAELAQATDISESTLRKIGSILTYHTNLANIEKLCRVLDVTPGDFLELIDDPPKARKKTKRSAKKSKKKGV